MTKIYLSLRAGTIKDWDNVLLHISELQVISPKQLQGKLSLILVYPYYEKKKKKDRTKAWMSDSDKLTLKKSY